MTPAVQTYVESRSITLAPGEVTGINGKASFIFIRSASADTFQVSADAGRGSWCDLPKGLCLTLPEPRPIGLKNVGASAATATVFYGVGSVSDFTLIIGGGQAIPVSALAALPTYAGQMTGCARLIAACLLWNQGTALVHRPVALVAGANRLILRRVLLTNWIAAAGVMVVNLQGLDAPSWLAGTPVNAGQYDWSSLAITRCDGQAATNTIKSQIWHAGSDAGACNRIVVSGSRGFGGQGVNLNIGQCSFVFSENNGFIPAGGIVIPPNTGIAVQTRAQTIGMYELGAPWSTLALFEYDEENA